MFDMETFAQRDHYLVPDKHAPSREHILKHLPFRNKAEYLLWRKEWSAALEANIDLVRQAKAAMAKPGGDPYAQSERQRLRRIGCNLVVLRHHSKKLSALQRSASFAVAPEMA